MNQAPQSHLRCFFLFNALGFQAVWWAWAIGAPQEHWLWPLLISLVFLSLHARWSTTRRADLRAVLACVVIGGLFDTALMQVQWLRFALPNPEPLHAIAPGWMFLLWASLACTLHTSLSWFRTLKLWRYPISAGFGWLAYVAADQLGALSLSDSVETASVLALFWATFLPWVQDWSYRSVAS